MRKSWIALAALCLVMAGCGVERQYERYDDLQIGANALTRQNHPHGYGRKDCFYCHVKDNIHQVVTVDFGIKLDGPGGVRDIVERTGTAQCLTCHGGNGVNQ